jgi:hypothetical protein
MLRPAGEASASGPRPPAAAADPLQGDVVDHRTPAERHERARLLTRESAEGEEVGGRAFGLVSGDVEDLGRRVAAEVGDLQGHGLAGDRQRGGEGQPAVLQDALAELFFLLGDDVDLGLAVAVKVSELDRASADEAGEGLALAQARLA